MTPPTFEGTVKPQRRGGWSARAILTMERHGQLFDTLIGTRAFPTERAATDWLRTLASEWVPGQRATIARLAR